MDEINIYQQRIYIVLQKLALQAVKCFTVKIRQTSCVVNIYTDESVQTHLKKRF